MAKRVATSSPPAAHLVFGDDALLSEIFDWTGRRAYIVIGAVCRRWRRRYTDIPIPGWRATWEIMQRNLESWTTRIGELMWPECGARLLQYAFDCGLSRSAYLTTAAAGKGNMAALRYARANGCDWARTGYRFACADAAENGHLDVLRFALRDGAPFADCTFLAAHHGRRAVLEGLREDGVVFDARTCAGAAGGGDLDLLMWLRQIGTPWGGDTSTAAAREGHVRVFAWALANGAELWSSATSSAAEKGHLDIFKMAIAHNSLSWNESMAADAAREGHIEILKYVVQEGLDWSPRECLRASVYVETDTWIKETCNIESDDGNSDEDDDE